MKNNAVGWFEVPVMDMDRAVAFYEQVLHLTLTRAPMGPLDMSLFPSVDGGLGTSGALVMHPDHYKPSADGVVLYFTAHSGDLANELGRVEAAGGKVLVKKRLIAPDVGFMGLAMDTEGNRFALHSRK